MGSSPRNVLLVVVHFSICFSTSRRVVRHSWNCFVENCKITMIDDEDGVNKNKTVMLGTISLHHSSHIQPGKLSVLHFSHHGTTDNSHYTKLFCLCTLLTLWVNTKWKNMYWSLNYIPHLIYMLYTHLSQLVECVLKSWTLQPSGLRPVTFILPGPGRLPVPKPRHNNQCLSMSGVEPALNEGQKEWPPQQITPESFIKPQWPCFQPTRVFIIRGLLPFRPHLVSLSRDVQHKFTLLTLVFYIGGVLVCFTCQM